MQQLHHLVRRVDALTDRLSHSAAFQHAPDAMEELRSAARDLVSITGPAFACPRCGASL